MFALMILGGVRYAMVLFAGVLVAEFVVLRSSLHWPIVFGIAAIIAGGYGAVALVARKNLRLDVGLNRLRDVLGLLAVGMAGAAMVARCCRCCCSPTISSSWPTSWSPPGLCWSATPSASP